MRIYDPIWFPVTAQAALHPVDGTPAIEARVAYDGGQPFGLQFRNAALASWDVAFADIPWHDAAEGIGALRRLAVRFFIWALRVLGSRLANLDSIMLFTPPTPVPGPAPADPALIPAYLNDQVRPYLGAVVQETARATNAALRIVNALLRLAQEP